MFLQLLDYFISVNHINVITTMGWSFLCCMSQPDRSKKKYSHVTTLDLSRCNLFEIPIDELMDPGNLLELDLSYNKLEDLNPLMMRCSQLKVFYS